MTLSRLRSRRNRIDSCPGRAPGRRRHFDRTLATARRPRSPGRGVPVVGEIRALTDLSKSITGFRRVKLFQQVDENDTRVASVSEERISRDQVSATAGGTQSTLRRNRHSCRAKQPPGLADHDEPPGDREHHGRHPHDVREKPFHPIPPHDPRRSWPKAARRGNDWRRGMVNGDRHPVRRFGREGRRAGARLPVSDHCAMQVSAVSGVQTSRPV